MTFFIFLALVGLLVGVASIAGKHRTVKAIDVAGLNFLSPVVRLCYGEEPRKQIQEIVRFIIVPILAVIAFILLWFAISEQIQTKSGKLPNPLETWRSAGAILAFHTRENDKQRAFSLSGEQREAELASVQARMEELRPEEEQANQLVAEAKAAAEASTQEAVAPQQKHLDELTAKYAKAKKSRETELAGLAATSTDRASKDEFVELVREHRQQLAAEKEELRAIKADIAAIRAEKSPAVARALAAQTAIAEERQYLGKMRDQLTGANRAEKVKTESAKLEAAKAALYAAPADDLLKEATKVVRSEDRIAKIEASDYAKPATLPFQVARSILCVFFYTLMNIF